MKNPKTQATLGKRQLQQKHNTENISRWVTLTHQITSVFTLGSHLVFFFNLFSFLNHSYIWSNNA